MREDEVTLAYGGGWVDRAGALRADPDRLATLLGAADARVLPLWQDRCLVNGAVPVRLSGEAATTARAAAAETVFLGFVAGQAVFAVDLSKLTEDAALAAAGAARTVDVRGLVGQLSPAEAAIQAYARGLLHWHRQQRYCGTCGGVTSVQDAGHARRCTEPDCARLYFPRIEPAIIVLVETAGSPGRCLLARHNGAAENAFSTLAGFVEVGETLEDAVRREVAEEAGVVVTDVAYQGSQAWPFPAGLMVGFRATAGSDEIRVDGVELLEARWFTRAELRQRAAAGHRLGRLDSIGHHLLNSWLAEDEAAASAPR
ncbi:NAD(+) diphosphatase [Salinispora fenicalii]|uniref:NAD(+) diphosphatase n=1 Tax=Salinispora fenicalii TaxID=1137263 RepID=UPI000365E2AD|nr:NAD(+) diphosphatase [Salinispora fenicalii]